jgi:hypothetical protein
VTQNRAEICDKSKKTVQKNVTHDRFGTALEQHIGVSDFGAGAERSERCNKMGCRT